MLEKTKFSTKYWFHDHSVKVSFEPIAHEPQQDLITACFVFAYTNDNKILLVKPKTRKWGLPGGHKENGETALDCVKRETLEEACVELENIRPLGRQRITQLKQTPENMKYPKNSFIIFYLAEVDNINAFSYEWETSDRAFVDFADISLEWQDEVDNTLLEIVDYAIESIENKDRNK